MELASQITVCLSHMYNTAGASLHRHIHNSNKSSVLSRWAVKQRDTQRHRPLITTNSLDIFVGICYVCHHWLVVNPAVDLLLYSHINFSWISTDFIPGGQGETVGRDWGASPSDICVHTSVLGWEPQTQGEKFVFQNICVIVDRRYSITNGRQLTSCYLEITEMLKGERTWKPTWRRMQFSWSMTVHKNKFN